MPKLTTQTITSTMNARDVINGRTVLGEQKEIQKVKNAYAE